MYSSPSILNANVSACDGVCTFTRFTFTCASLFKTRRNGLLLPARSTLSGIQVDWATLPSLTFYHCHCGASQLVFPLTHGGEYKWATHWKSNDSKWQQRSLSAHTHRPRRSGMCFCAPVFQIRMASVLKWIYSCTQEKEKQVSALRSCFYMCSY